MVFLSLALGVLPGPHAPHRTAVPQSVVRLSESPSRGALLRVVHQVSDPAAVATFYQGSFGFEPVHAEDVPGTTRLVSSSGALPQLELVRTEGGSFSEGAGYLGLSVRVADVAAAVAAAVTNGGSVLQEPRVVPHGPSLEPLEDDEVITPVEEATVADPCGFPVNLYNDTSCMGSVLCGVRLATDDWKKTQEWWQSELGWKTLRWQSDVPRLASLNVLLGGPGERRLGGVGRGWVCTSGMRTGPARPGPVLHPSVLPCGVDFSLGIRLVTPSRPAPIRCRRCRWARGTLHRRAALIGRQHDLSIRVEARAAGQRARRVGVCGWQRRRGEAVRPELLPHRAWRLNATPPFHTGSHLAPERDAVRFRCTERGRHRVCAIGSLYSIFVLLRRFL